MIGAAEQRELHLLVLRAGVHLRSQLAELHLEFTEVVLAGGEPVDEALTTDVRHVGGVLSLLALRAEIEDGLLCVLHALHQRRARGLLLVESAGLLVERGAAGVGLAAETGDAALEVGERGGELAPLEIALRQREVAEAEAEALVAHRLRGLAAERADLAGDFGDNVGDAREILSPSSRSERRPRPR